MRPGEGTGYGLRWRADGPRTIAIVPAGYADGLDTRMAGRARVLVRGRRVPVVGSVCMDMIMIDVTGLDVSPGDEVVIIGRQGDDEITAREMAAAIGTIPWEVVCRLGAGSRGRYADNLEVRSMNSKQVATSNQTSTGRRSQTGSQGSRQPVACGQRRAGGGRTSVRMATNSFASAMNGVEQCACAERGATDQAQPDSGIRGPL